MDQDKFKRPTYSKLRRPEGLEKGKEYPLLQLCRDKSKFPDKKTGKDVMKTLAIFKEFGITFHVYLPYDFDNKADDYYVDINKKIKAADNIRLVMYGKLNTSNDLLMEGDVVDTERLAGLKKIEEIEQESYGGPSKKLKLEN